VQLVHKAIKVQLAQLVLQDLLVEQAPQVQLVLKVLLEQQA
jgi:hypothetical protein